MALKSVTEELKILKDSQDDTTKAVTQVVKIMQAQLDMEKSKQYDDAEARLEAKKVTAQASKGGNQGGGKDKLKNPFIGFFPASRFILPAVAAIAASLVGFDDAVKALKLPDQLKNIKNGLKSVSKALKIDFKDFKLPEKFTLKMPESFTKTLDSITEGLGKFKPGGGGLFGMLKGLGTFLDTIGGPVLRAAKFLLLPLAPFLTLIDFVVGFYKGFTGVEEVTDRFGRTRFASTGEKIMAGLEGGLLGIVKGITGAFDFLFIEIPKYLLRLFGLDGIAEILEGFSITDMVDPIWNGIKKSFMDYFGPLENGESRLKKIFDAAYEDILGVFSKLFDFMPSFKEMKARFLSIMPDWFRSAFQSDEDKAIADARIDNNPQTQQKMIVSALDQEQMMKLREAAARLKSGFYQTYDPDTNSFKITKGNRVATFGSQVPTSVLINKDGTYTELGLRKLNQNRISAENELKDIMKSISYYGMGDQLKQFLQENRDARGAMGNQIFTTNSQNNVGNTIVGGTTNFQAALLEAGDVPTIIPGTGRSGF